MKEIQPCPPSGEIASCCLLAVPNTSTWQVVCPNATAAPAAVPTLTAWAGVLLTVLLVVAAFRRLR